MPLTRSQTKKLHQLNELDQFKFKPNITNTNHKKRRLNANKSSANTPPSKRQKLNDHGNVHETNQKTKKKSKKKISIKYDEIELKNNSDDNITIKESAFIRLTQSMIDEGNKNSAPPHWIDVYNEIFSMRNNPKGIAFNADVDNIGAACLYDKNMDIKTQRFHVLVSLLLSSQTKDIQTANAVYNLQQKFKGLTVDSICSVNVENMKQINECINCVGFHNKKTKYLYKTAQILKCEYNGDIPCTVNDLCNLPGIGPKMAYIIMQIAWNQNIGIGVDVHVHRITNLLKWTRNKKCLKPENTRKELQLWIPKKLWPSINRLFVGFGQTVCTPKKPKCNICKIKKWCPIGQKIYNCK